MKNKKLRNEFIERLDTLSEDIHAHPLETRYDKFTMMKNTLIAEAKEAGKFEGENSKAMQIARNMLIAKKDINEIALFTGLSLHEIQNLK